MPRQARIRRCGACWRASARRSAAPEHRTVAGEEIDDWRDAFRLIQGFETTVDAAALHPVAQCRSRPGHQGALRGGGANQLCRGRCRAQQAQGDRAAPRRSPAPGHGAGAADDADTAARARDSRWRLVRRVPHANARLYLPRRPCRPAADLDSRDRGRRLPDRPVFHRLEGRRRGLARSRRHARSHA